MGNGIPVVSWCLAVLRRLKAFHRDVRRDVYLAHDLHDALGRIMIARGAVVGHLPEEDYRNTAEMLKQAREQELLTSKPAKRATNVLIKFYERQAELPDSQSFEIAKVGFYIRASHDQDL